VTRPQLTVIDGGLIRTHRRERKALERCRRLGFLAQRMDVPEGSRTQYKLIDPDDGVEMWCELGELERFVKWEEGRR